MSGPVLSLRNLSIGTSRSSGQQRRLVEAVSLELEAGRTLAIIGESGSGKSLTALSLIGLVPDALTVDPGTEIVINGHPVKARDERTWRQLRGHRIAMIFQDPMACLNPFMRIGDQIEETLIHGGIKARGERRQRTIAALADVDLPDPAGLAGRYPHELSGGQQQRVMIAMSLAGKANILIADEPTSALDASVQAGIVALLTRLQAERGFAMLIITHDLAVAGALADDIAVMERGRIVERGAARDVLTKPQHPYSARLVGAHKAFTARVERTAASTGMAVVGRALCIDYTPRGLFGSTFRAVHQADISIPAGRTVGLLGESGSGKSTLALAIAGLAPLANGRLEVMGHDLSAGKRLGHGTRRQCQMVFQNPYGALNPRMTIGQALDEPLALAGLPKIDRHARVAEALADVGLPPDYDNRFPGQLSGGQRQRANIARALLCDPRVMICDEAISALDMTVKVQILELLRQLQSRHGFAMLFVGHDIDAVNWISDEVLVMSRGRIVDRYCPEDLADTGALASYTRSLLQARLMPVRG